MALGFYEKLETGDIIGSLEILGYSHSDSGNNRWLDVRCFCGKEFKASAWRLKKRHTKSCGCLKRKICFLRNVSTPYKERCQRAKKGWDTRRIKNKNK